MNACLFLIPDTTCDSPELNEPGKLCKSPAVRWYLMDGDFLSRCGRHPITVKRFNGRPVVTMSYEEAVVASMLKS